jgi:hypothetical protein
MRMLSGHDNGPNYIPMVAYLEHKELVTPSSRTIYFELERTRRAAYTWCGCMCGPLCRPTAILCQKKIKGFVETCRLFMSCKT